MARIRSIHPSIFTGDSFMEATAENPIACLFLFGLWGQADDKGAFEWKPATLKARILPATSADAASILEYLSGLNFIAAYEVDGKKYGAIRKFGEFQRPKTPNDLYPMPKEWRIYACTAAQISEKRPAQRGVIGETDAVKRATFLPKGEMKNDEQAPFLPKGEIVPQMEEIKEEGGGEERKKEDPPFCPPSPISPPAPTALRAPKNKPRSQLPDRWEPSEAGRALAAEKRLDLPETVARFRDYHVAKGTLMANWDAAWGTWCRSPYNAPAAGTGPPGHKTHHSEQARQHAELFGYPK
jgi:hypothetical protein